jgi:hypothetical protein
MISHNPNDVAQRYCGFCHEFHSSKWDFAIPMNEHINDYRARYGLPPYPMNPDEGIPWDEWRAVYLDLLTYWIATHDKQPGETNELELLLWLNENASARRNGERPAGSRRLVA